MNNLTELWKALILSLAKARKSKIQNQNLQKDGTIQFQALENVNTFKRFYSE